MPRLDYPKLTKGEAIATVVGLYLQEPNFVTELSDILVPFIRKHRKLVIESRNYGRRKHHKKPFPAERYLSQSDIGSFCEGLSKLADKWKFRAPWATPYFLYLAGYVTFKSLGIRFFSYKKARQTKIRMFKAACLTRRKAFITWLYAAQDGQDDKKDYLNFGFALRSLDCWTETGNRLD